MTFLNRVFRYCPGNRPAVELEADQRHVELILKELNLQNESKGVDVPSVKRSADDVIAEQSLPVMPLEDVRRYRSVVMRAAYLSLDRPDIAESVKQCSRRMQNPTVADWALAKRLGRYLKNNPCYVLKFVAQPMPSFFEIQVDSDFAGCPITRKSTSGSVARFGDHTLQTQSALQSTISLSSGEAEYYAMLKGAANGLKLVAIAKDFGLDKEILVATREPPVEIGSDSTAALAFAQRKGLGRQKHVMTRFLWLQDAIRAKKVRVRKVHTKLNMADPLTKSTSRQTIEKHMKAMGYVKRESWSKLHRTLKSER